MDHIVAAGVLPISVHNKQIMILLGREVEFNTWCGFGGGRDEGETILECAAREFTEESMALIMSPEAITDILQSNSENRLIANYHTNVYMEYLVFIPYDANLPALFDRVYQNFNSCYRGKHPTCNQLFEKDQIRWMNLDHLITLAHQPDSNFELRPCFRESILSAEPIWRTLEIVD